MGMDQYFTIGQEWPEQLETFRELRNCRALNHAIERHAPVKRFQNGEFKGAELNGDTIREVRKEIYTGDIWNASFREGFYEYEREDGKDLEMLAALNHAEDYINLGNTVFYHVSA